MQSLSEICENRMKLLHLEKDVRYVKRLKWEIEEIYAKDKSNYFLDLYHRKVKYPVNQILSLYI